MVAHDESRRVILATMTAHRLVSWTCTIFLCLSNCCNVAGPTAIGTSGRFEINELSKFRDQTKSAEFFLLDGGDPDQSEVANKGRVT